MTGEVTPAVWTYWEDPPGRPRAAYLDLCLETIKKHSAPIPLRILGRADTPGWLPDMDVERWERLPAPHYRSDYARSRLLQRYGGLWIDIDTIAMSPLSELLDAVDDTGVACFGRELGRFFGGLCAARAGAAFVDAWVDEQDLMLDRFSDWSALGYAALAQDVTWPTARRLPWKSLPMGMVAPIPWYQWRRFLSRLESPARLMAGGPVTVVLWNAVMAPFLRPRSRSQLLVESMLICRLLRIALGISLPDGEEDLWTKLHSFSQWRFSTPGQKVETIARRLLSGQVPSRPPLDGGAP